MDVKRRILVAEDECNISDFLRRGLEDCGFDVVVAADGAEAWRLIERDMASHPFGLLLLDIKMPGMSGIEVCKQFRGKYGYAVPVLMLTALCTTDDVVLGLNAGADDYLVKPFKFVELVARIEALMRRSAALVSSGGVGLQCGDLTCFPSTHKAVRGSVEVELSTKEYRLLEYFVRHQGELLSRQQLLRDVWDKNFDTSTNVVDVYVRYVRSKIDDPFEHKLIHTIIGAGYMMQA